MTSYIMSEPRFTVRWYHKHHPGSNLGLPPGYAVFDHGNRITITFQNYGEALQHCENISKLYARFGFLAHYAEKEDAS